MANNNALVTFVPANNNALVAFVPNTNNIVPNTNNHMSNKKKSPKIGNPFWHEKQCIFTNQPSYFCLFLAILPICESVANLHESTLLFALNIHAYFCLFLSFDL